MNKNDFTNWSIETALKIGLVFMVLLISFMIIKPFIVLLAWGAIIAIAFYPLQKILSKRINNKNNLAATILTLVLLSILIVPTIMFVNALVDNASLIVAGIKDGSIAVPPPNEKLKGWPLIGKPVYEFWSMASTNMKATFIEFQPEIGKVVKWIAESVKNLMGSVAVFFIALVISGALIAKGKEIYTFAVALADKLVGKKGKALIDNSVGTVQSVVKGVIGVAIIQSFLIGLGFYFADIPAASILTLVVFILALIQLPSIIVVLPVIIYVFSAESTTTAILFAVYEMVAGLSDNVLKPLLLGRGVKIPMLVILIGSIGGMILMGMIGLFVGSVVLALAYQIFMFWMEEEAEVED